MSYRRDETEWQAGWIAEMLIGRYGEGVVFKDFDSIKPGDNLVEVINEAVGSCEVLLALIGDRLLSMTGPDERRRLDDPADVVRLEIEAALARNICVIPVLIEGARMPRADELPDSLAKLARRQAIELRPRYFKSDAGSACVLVDRACHSTVRTLESACRIPGWQLFRGADAKGRYD